MATIQGVPTIPVAGGGGSSAVSQTLANSKVQQAQQAVRNGTMNQAQYNAVLEQARLSGASSPGFVPYEQLVGGGELLGATTTAPSGGGGVSYPALNTGAIANTQKAIDELPGLLEAALAAEAQNRTNTLNQFQAQEDAQRGTYDQSTITNQQNYDSNFMDSIRAGIKGLGGLFSLLRGTGAAGGTAQDLVRDTVGGVTANDIRTGADTQRENQSALDASLSTFLTDLKGKRQGAEDTFQNNQNAIRRDNATQMQDLYSKMAGYYGDAGRTSEANSWMARAGNLTPEIARNSRSVVSAYDTTPVAVQAPQLSAFAAPSQPNIASIPQDGQVGSGIFTINKKKENQVALPVGA